VCAAPQPFWSRAAQKVTLANGGNAGSHLGRSPRCSSCPMRACAPGMDKGDKDSANATQRSAGPADHGMASSARAENLAQCYATVNQRSTNG